jgi:transcriptional regulator with XRE-family HTH domain
MNSKGPMMADEIPTFLRKLMDAADLTQHGLAAKVEVSQGTISKWLSGTHSPNTQQWNRVLRFARQNSKTKHLAGEAPELSLDALVDPYGPEAKAGARLVLEAYLKTLPRPS